MSPLLVALTAVALVAIVPLLCFVGCSFSAAGIPVDYGKYNDTVSQTTGLVAFWPLIESTGPIAFDNGPQAHNGTYTQGQNVPYDSVDESAAASGAVNVNQPGIVPGDQVNNTVNPCPYFDGGFVSVPWNAAINPPPSFTLEAWVKPDWSAQDPKAFRVIVGSNDYTAFTGIQLYVSDENFWAASIGTGSGFAVAKPAAGSNQTVALGSLSYLVMTFDGTTLTLWVNPADTAAAPYAQATASGFAPVASPTPLYIGTGHPDLAKPLFPFKGWIQDVALYNVVLDGTTIETHYMNGNGIQMT